jgi:hypothetical protein
MVDPVFPRGTELQEFAPDSMVPGHKPHPVLRQVEKSNRLPRIAD